MNVLIFGASGQTGSYLSEQYIAQGANVYNASRTNGLFSPAESRFIHFDALSGSEILTILTQSTPDVVINLLSLSSVFECARNPEMSKQLNADFVLDLIGAIAEYEQINGSPVKFLQASSSEMYSGYPAGSVISEIMEPKPLTTYGIHKTIAHFATLERSRDQKNSQAVVLFNHESPRRSLKFVSRKITNGLVSMKFDKLEQLTLGNINSRRDWGFASDYASGIRKLIENQNLTTIVLASGELHSVSDFFTEGAKYLEIHNPMERIAIDPNLLREKENDGLIGDPSMAKQKLSWARSIEFNDLVRLMIDSELQRRNIE